MTNYYYADLGAAQRDGIHINANQPGKKSSGYTSYYNVEKDIHVPEDKACAIVVACALAILTIGIIFIFSPDFRANLLGRKIVAVHVEDPQEDQKDTTTSKTDDAAKNTIPTPPFSINNASIFDIHSRFLKQDGFLNNRIFFQLSGKEMLELSNRLHIVPMNFSVEEIQTLLSTLPLEELTARQFTFFSITNLLDFATKEQVEKLHHHLISPEYYARVNDAVFQTLTITAANASRMLDCHRGTNCSRLSLTQIKQSFSHLTPYLRWLNLDQMTRLYHAKELFRQDEIETLKLHNIYARQFFAETQSKKDTKDPFSYTLTVEDLPASGPLREFYDKFKRAERNGEWHKVFDLQPGFSSDALQAARKKMMLRLHPDKNPQHREQAVKIFAAFNSLSEHLKK